MNGIGVDPGRSAPGAGLEERVRSAPGVVRFKSRTAGSVQAAIVDRDSKGTIAGFWQAEDVHYIDMSLTARPTPCKGRFVDWSEKAVNFGKVFFVPAGVRLHAQGSAGRQTGIELYLVAKAQDGEEEDREVQFRGVDQYLDIRCNRVTENLFRISQEVSAPGFASDLMIEGLSLVLLADLRRLLRNHQQGISRLGGLAPWRLRLINQRLHDDPCAPSITELAEACGLTRRHLMRAFRQETGRTLGAYLEAITLERAKQRLRETRASVAEIAMEAGFKTASGFSAAFRKVTGLSPRVYRALK